MTFFFDENKKCCPPNKPTPPVECCIDLPIDGKDVIYRGVTLKILDVNDGEDHDSIIRKIDEIINNLNTSSGGNYFFKNIGDGEVLFKALTDAGEVLFKTIKTDGTINIEAGEDSITLSAGEQYLKHVKSEDSDENYLENIEGNSIRMNEGYEINNPRDLITREYYENNMPEIPEGNLIISDNNDEFLDYLNSEKAKVGQLIYNVDENKYFTIVDNGNHSLEYKEFSSTLEYDVKSDLTVGAIEAGQTLPEGMTFTEFVETLLQKTFYPTYTAPSFSASNNAGTREVGETFNITVTVSFNRGRINGKNVDGVWSPTTQQESRAGSATSYTINEVQQQTASRSFSTTARATAQTFSNSVNYAPGPIPYDSKGNYLYNEALPGGILTANTSYTGYYRRFSGSVDSVPTSGATLRSTLLSNSVLNTGNSFTMGTGTTNKNFIIAVPPGKTLSRVVNQNTNQDLTVDFVLSTTLTSVPDASGVDVTGYKVYIMTNDVPFTANQTLNITLT